SGVPRRPIGDDMDLDILKTVGQIAGIGGIALGVVFLLFREVIRKAIFPQLGPQQGYRLLRLIVILTFLIAALGLTAWTWTSLLKDGKKADAGKVAVSAIEVDDLRQDGTAVLDIRLVNRGGRPVGVNAVTLAALKVDETESLGALDFTAKYDADISDLHKAGDSKAVKVSQALQPGEIDRIAVTLAARDMGGGVFRVWRLQPTLQTTEGAVQADPIVVGLPWNIQKSAVLPRAKTPDSAPPT
ncbi:MAG TPA: hypothetical protein VGE98_13245, partial [Thermoanaerobaculia bacterium]